MIKRTIYFATHDYQEIQRIRKDYGIRGNLNVNGEIECELDEADAGLIQIRKK